MEHPCHSSLLRFALLLAILCSFTTAFAYDFEVDGIYYNITSPNTVEVTYKDTYYNSYSGGVTIPSTVIRNGKTYNVTTIGDYAFYDSEGIFDLTIPETVLSIGEYAFYGCHPLTMTCLAMEAPTLNNSFDTDCPWRFDYWFTSDPMHILYVKPEAFDDYYNSYWVCCFDYTLKTNEECTSIDPESVSSDLYSNLSSPICTISG